jgi:hypothetical protein
MHGAIHDAHRAVDGFAVDGQPAADVPQPILHDGDDLALASRADIEEIVAVF